MTASPPARTPVLGVGISAIDMAMALAVVDGWVRARAGHFVCVTGVHGVMECQRDPELARIHADAGLVTPDGMPLVWLSRWRGQPHVERVYGPDLMLAACEQFVDRGYRHYLYGGGEGVAEELSARLRARLPAVRIVGHVSPPFRELTATEDAVIVDRIRATQPDIVWVGLGTPKQERWMATHGPLLPEAVLIGVGAAFDFHAGRKRQAPGWMRRSGLEWLFRLASEPRRLWRRYLYNNPAFVALLVAEAVGWYRPVRPPATTRPATTRSDRKPSADGPGSPRSLE